MAYWAANRRALGLDKPKPRVNCQNPGCKKQLAVGRAYCWLCALFGGQRKIR